MLTFLASRHLRNAILVLNCGVADGARASVAAFCVVLTVEEPISVVAVDIALAVAVIAAPRVVHVNVGIHPAGD